jgi:hypothetical protein
MVKNVEANHLAHAPGGTCSFNRAKILESRRRQLRVAYGVDDVAVAQPILQRPRVVAPRWPTRSRRRSMWAYTGKGSLARAPMRLISRFTAADVRGGRPFLVA